MKYEDILKKHLSKGEWLSEEKITSDVVREKYGFSKASKKRQSSALNALKIGYRAGMFKKGFREDDGKIFWTVGSGAKNEVVIIGREETGFNLSISELRAKAIKNITHLEDFLKEFCAAALLEKFKDRWEEAVPIRTLVDLKGRLRTTNSNMWNPGGPRKLLDLASILDMSKIIGKNWELVFQSKLDDRFFVCGKLGEFSNYRNNIIHNGDFKLPDLTTKEYLYFNIGVELFLEKYKNLHNAR